MPYVMMIFTGQVFGMASGHINPSLPLARRLVSEGHKVRVMLRNFSVKESLPGTLNNHFVMDGNGCFIGWKWRNNHFLVDGHGFLLDGNGDVQPFFSG